MSTLSPADVMRRVLQLREAKDQLTAQYKANKQRLDEAEEKLEGALLNYLLRTGQQMIKLPDGKKAFKSTKTFVSTTDKKAFQDWVIEHEYWHMLPASGLKTEIIKYEQEQGAAPPGTKIEKAFVINVRKS